MVDQVKIRVPPLHRSVARGLFLGHHLQCLLVISAASSYSSEARLLSPNSYHVSPRSGFRLCGSCVHRNRLIEVASLARGAGIDD